MNRVSRPVNLLAILLIVLAILACRLPFGLGQPEATPTATLDPSTPTRSREPTWTSIPRSPTPSRTPRTPATPQGAFTSTPEPLVINGPTETLPLEPEETFSPEPTETFPPEDQLFTPTPAQAGMGRSKPAPRNAVVLAPNWDVQVMDYKRGTAAWKDLEEANPFNEAPGAGEEYVLVKLRVKCTYADSDPHAIMAFDFKLTGSRLQAYDSLLVDTPGEELYAELTTGGQTEGWAAFLAAKDEKNLILVVDEMANFDEDRLRYIALDDNASISIAPELAAIRPTDLGRDADNPAAFNDRLVTQNWELSMLEMLRGDSAMQRLLQVWEENPAPLDGMEYVLLRVNARYIGTQDRPERIDLFYFNTLDNQGYVGDYGEAQPPEPVLDAALYPGGEVEGWLILQVRKGAGGLKLVFQPMTDESTENQRYISLE